ncbi:hypothetical protein AB0B85_16185 [Micromonospora sp. NPDC049044]|uniref:hypothetical protein n=1 Tax=Micromonospora sp. NPDC049044 TaxID=3154827 RepID=UPI0033D217CC
MNVALWKKTAGLTIAAVTAFAGAACSPQTDSTEASDKQPSVLELLASDLKGSLQKTVDSTAKTDSVALTMKGNVNGQSISMQGHLNLGDPAQAELRMTVPDGPEVTARMIGPVVFVEVPAAQRATTGGKRWMKMDMTAMNGGKTGTDFAKQFDDMDPIKQVRTLLGIEGTTVVGQETVNGATTVHYTVTTPVATYLKQIDAKMRAASEQAFTAQGVKEIKLDLWVDEQYRPRRVSLVMGKVSDMVIDYTDYGKTVTIEAPPAAETADLAEMLKSRLTTTT